jgi:hypothetical protein
MYSINDIPAKFQKAWHYANFFMHGAIKTPEHCVKFLEDLNKFNQEEKDFMLWAWVLIKTGQNIGSPLEDKEELETPETPVEADN